MPSGDVAESDSMQSNSGLSRHETNVCTSPVVTAACAGVKSVAEIARAVDMARFATRFM